MVGTPWRRYLSTQQDMVAHAADEHSKEVPMLGKVMVILATVVALTGAMSAEAFARGAPVGPMGQVFGGVNRADHPVIFGNAGRAYGYGAHARPHKRVNNH